MPGQSGVDVSSVACRVIGSIHGVADKPRQALPWLNRVSAPRGTAKMKAQAEAGEMDRTRPSRKTLQRIMGVLHSAIV